MKKLIAILLAAALMLPMLCVSAAAASKCSLKASRAYGSGYTYLTLTSNADALYYTTDGSTPTSSSAEYTKRLRFTKPTDVRVAAYMNGRVISRYKLSVEVKVKAPVLTQTEGDSYLYYYYKVSSAEGAKVYYTTDGSKPSEKNRRFAENGDIISVSSGTTINAMAVKSGWRNSSIRTVVSPAEHPAAAKEAEFEAEVIRLVNKARAEKGLSALATFDMLDEAVQIRADELTTLYSHTRPDGSKCFTVFEELGIPRGAAAENIAAGYDTPEEVMEGWLNSAGHYANIMNPAYNYIGVGFAAEAGGYGFYWAQLFMS